MCQFRFNLLELTKIFETRYCRQIFRQIIKDVMIVNKVSASFEMKTVFSA